MAKLKLEPSLTWQVFDEICAIPHPSGHETALRDHLRRRVEEQGLTTLIDETGNLLIEKAASPGCEKAKTVILQAHLDMVPQHIAGIEFDFTRDPIIPVIEVGMVTTGGKTTLGADNGIGVALAMDLLLSNDVRHGPLKALFTISEETGLDGANGLDGKFLDGDILINLDGGGSDQILIGCAGGTRMRGIFAAEWQDAPPDCCGVSVTLSGLAGGHSGRDIDKQRGNAVKIMAELISAVSFGIAKLDGGTLQNAIPREARALFALPLAERDSAVAGINAFLLEQQGKLSVNEPDFRFQVEVVPAPAKVWLDALRCQVTAVLLECPHGVVAMSEHASEQVGTSINLASVKTGETAITITTMTRSESKDRQRQVVGDAMTRFEKHGARCEVDSEYPAWEPDRNSAILRIVNESFQELFGTIPQIVVEHSGLECGIFAARNPRLELVSIGPDIFDLHSPSERLDIASVERFRRLTIKTLEKVASRAADGTDKQH